MHSSDEGESYSMTDESYQSSSSAAETPKISKQMAAYTALPKENKKKKPEPFKQQPQFPSWLVESGGMSNIADPVDEDM